MAPRDVNGSTEEREAFMAQVFREYYENPKNTKDLSIQKANDLFRKKYGSMLRNKKAYQIRDAVKAQVRSGGRQPPQVKQAARNPETVPAGSARAATIVEGTQEQIAWLKDILPQLNAAGLSQARVDHSTDAYAVVART